MRTADSKFGMDGDSVVTDEVSGASAADKGKSSAVPFKQRLAKGSNSGLTALNQS